MNNVQRKPALPLQTEHPIFDKVGDLSELGHMNSEERRKYFISLNKYRTNLSVMQNEHEEGLAEGLKKGRNERNVEIVRNAKSMGMEPAVISQLTGLSITEIESIFSAL